MENQGETGEEQAENGGVLSDHGSKITGERLDVILGGGTLYF